MRKAELVRRLDAAVHNLLTYRREAGLELHEEDLHNGSRQLLSLAMHLPHWDLEDLGSAVRLSYLVRQGRQMGPRQVDLARKVEVDLSSAGLRDYERVAEGAALFHMDVGFIDD